MVKMIVCDMDGTLLGKDESISNENLQAIQWCQEHGIRFSVATGRSGQLMKPYLEEIGLVDPFVMCNGALIGHPDQEDDLYKDLMSPTDVTRIIEVAKQFQADFIIYTKDTLYATNSKRKDILLKRNKHLKQHQQVVIQDATDSVVFNNVNKVLVLVNNMEQSNAIEKALGQFQSIQSVVSGTGYIDINNKGNNKGIAVMKLCEYYGFDKEEVVVFGDQDNDVEMLSMFPNSVCMENGSIKAKKAAKHITSSAADSGVASWINKNIKK